MERADSGVAPVFEHLYPKAGLERTLLQPGQEDHVELSTGSQPLCNINGYDVLAQITTPGDEPLFVARDQRLRHRLDDKLCEFVVGSADSLLTSKGSANATPLIEQRQLDRSLFGGRPFYRIEYYNDPIDRYRPSYEHNGLCIVAITDRNAQEPNAAATHRIVRIAHDGSSRATYEVTMHTDESKPVNRVQAHRERKAVGEVEQVGHTSLRTKLVDSIILRASLDWQSRASQRTQEADTIKAIALNDLTWLDDQATLHPDNVTAVGEAVEALEDGLDEQLIQEFRARTTKHNQLRRGLGRAGLAAMAVVAYTDFKLGGPLTHASHINLHKPVTYLENVVFWSFLTPMVKTLDTARRQKKIAKRIDDYEDNVRPHDLTNLVAFEREGNFGETSFIERLYVQRIKDLQNIADTLYYTLPLPR